MKVLVYGAGVIGGQLVHALSIAGNDVTVIARGAWKETLQKDGLRIHHHIQKKDTVDHPRVLDKPDNKPYDIALYILPIVYLCYKTGCDLKKSTRQDRKLLLDAVRDAYHLLMELGVPVRPKSDEKTLEPGFANKIVKLVIYGMSRTRIGALCTTEHCRHAPGEMEDIDSAFQQLRSEKPDFPMPFFEQLYSEMPSWEQIRKIYGGRT